MRLEKHVIEIMSKDWDRVNHWARRLSTRLKNVNPNTSVIGKYEIEFLHELTQLSFIEENWARQMYNEFWNYYVWSIDKQPENNDYRKKSDINTILQRTD